MKVKSRKKYYIALSLVLAVCFLIGFFNIPRVNAASEQATVDYDSYTDTDDSEINILVDKDGNEIGLVEDSEVNGANIPQNSVKLKYSIQQYAASVYSNDKKLYRRNSDITVDKFVEKSDPIVGIIPKEIFKIPNKKTVHIGREYGFFVDTKSGAPNTVIANVYLFDIVNNTNLIDEAYHVKFTIQPLFQREYVYIAEGAKNINLRQMDDLYKILDERKPREISSENGDIVFPVPYVVKNTNTFKYKDSNDYYLSDIKSLVSLKNEQHANESDDGYSAVADKGKFLIQQDIEYKSHAFIKNTDGVTDSMTVMLRASFDIFVGTLLDAIGVGLVTDIIGGVVESIKAGEDGEIVQGNKFTHKPGFTTADSQIQQYGRLAKNGACELNLPKENVSNGDYMFYDIGDFFTSDYQLGHTSVDSEDNTGYKTPWDARLKRGIGLAFRSQKTGSIETKNESCYDFLIRDESNREYIEMETSQTAYLLPGGENLFTFTPNASGRYVFSAVDAPAVLDFSGENATVKPTGKEGEWEANLLNGHQYILTLKFVDEKQQGSFEFCQKYMPPELNLNSNTTIVFDGSTETWVKYTNSDYSSYEMTFDKQLSLHIYDKDMNLISEFFGGKANFILGEKGIFYFKFKSNFSLSKSYTVRLNEGRKADAWKNIRTVLDANNKEAKYNFTPKITGSYLVRKLTQGYSCIFSNADKSQGAAYLLTAGKEYVLDVKRNEDWEGNAYVSFIIDSFGNNMEYGDNTVNASRFNCSLNDFTAKMDGLHTFNLNGKGTIVDYLNGDELVSVNNETLTLNLVKGETINIRTMGNTNEFLYTMNIALDSARIVEGQSVDVALQASNKYIRRIKLTMSGVYSIGLLDIETEEEAKEVKAKLYDMSFQEIHYLAYGIVEGEYYIVLSSAINANIKVTVKKVTDGVGHGVVGDLSIVAICSGEEQLRDGNENGKIDLARGNTYQFKIKSSILGILDDSVEFGVIVIDNIGDKSDFQGNVYNFYNEESGSILIVTTNGSELQLSCQFDLINNSEVSFVLCEDKYIVEFESAHPAEGGDLANAAKISKCYISLNGEGRFAEGKEITDGLIVFEITPYISLLCIDIELRITYITPEGIEFEEDFSNRVINEGIAIPTNSDVRISDNIVYFSLAENNSKNESNINSVVYISQEVKILILSGKTGVNFGNLSFVVSPRTEPLYIYLENVKFTSQQNRPAISAGTGTELKIICYGNNAIYGKSGVRTLMDRNGQCAIEGDTISFKGYQDELRGKATLELYGGNGYAGYLDSWTYEVGTKSGGSGRHAIVCKKLAMEDFLTVDVYGGHGASGYNTYSGGSAGMGIYVDNLDINNVEKLIVTGGRGANGLNASGSYDNSYSTNGGDGIRCVNLTIVSSSVSGQGGDGGYYRTSGGKGIVYSNLSGSIASNKSGVDRGSKPTGGEDPFKPPYY